MIRASLIVAVIGCGTALLADVDPPGTEPPAAAGPFDAALLRIAGEYKKYPRVSDRANWAPAMCEAPAPAGVQKSRSEDAPTHGRKLYFLFAKDATQYDEMSSYGTLDYPGTKKEEAKAWVNPVGQTVVKESFAPVEVQKADIPNPTVDPERVRQPELPDHYVRDGEKYFKTGEQTQRCSMTKIEPKTPGTDGGWVYGVVSADGKTVLGAGTIESCMKCHQQTTRDRLYGHRWSWPLNKDGKVEWKKAEK